ASRVGVWGWSYGGYMSSLCILKGNDVFKTAIAISPVTTWRYYDTIYTERYLKTPQLNPSGYDDNSPIQFAKDMQGDYLLVHGMADDNVHFQNAVDWAAALINANKQFDQAYYPNKNHSIFGGVTRFHLYTKMTEFIKAKL
ncbi:MAG: prolyl oligopeptidase family serine peptidase, partial [Bacteroidota bacterium]